MVADMERIIVVIGATGLQGGAVTRHLLSSGWRVRVLTRNPSSDKARTLSALGAEVVQGDMEKTDTKPTLARHPDALSVRAWLEKQKRKG